MYVYVHTSSHTRVIRLPERKQLFLKLNWVNSTFAEEVEELSGRLKASRQRVADLERSFTTASTASNKHEQVGEI